MTIVGWVLAAYALVAVGYLMATWAHRRAREGHETRGFRFGFHVAHHAYALVDDDCAYGRWAESCDAAREAMDVIVGELR